MVSCRGSVIAKGEIGAGVCFSQIISCLRLGRRLLMSTCLVLTNAGGSGLLLFAATKLCGGGGGVFTMGRGDFLSPAHT